MALAHEPLEAGRALPAKRTLSSFIVGLVKGPDAQGDWGNASISYSLTALAIALEFLQANNSAFHPPPQWAKTLLQAAAFVGTLLGMAAGGVIADRYGRRLNMLMAQTLTLLGVVGTALASWGTVTSVYAIIIVCRVIMGFGIGATYPSAFASISESHDSELEGNERIGYAYLNQTWAALAPYLLGWALSAMPYPADPDTVSIPFRIILVAGALPAAMTWLAAYYRQDTLPSAARKQQQVQMQQRQHLLAEDPSVSKKDLAIGGASASGSGRGFVQSWRDFAAWSSVPSNRIHLWHLFGTASSWFCYDAAYYSVALFLPDLLTSVFGKDNSVASTCWQSSILVSIGAPATFAALWYMRRFGPRSLNVWGFALLGLVFGILGILFSVYPPGTESAAKFAVYCCLAFALSWGPSVGVHVMGSSTFPTEIRGRFIGISAASGKLGALLGSLLFSQLQESWGTNGLMFFEVAVAVIGMVVSQFFLPPGAMAGKDNVKHSGPSSAIQEAIINDDDDDVVDGKGASAGKLLEKPLLLNA